MTAPFTLTRHRAAGGSLRAAIRRDGALYDAAGLLGDPALAEIPALLERLASLADAILTARGTPLPPQRPEVPVPGSVALFCAAANFSDHMLAMAAKLGIQPEPDPRTLDVKPYHFLKPARQCLAPDGASIALPTHAALIDWEVELAAVIGRPARNVSPARALDHVAGYLVANDLSARDRGLMKRVNVPDGSLFRTDFIGMKAFDGACPVSTDIVPAAFVPDPQALEMDLSVNGTERQHSSTARMIFTVAEQIAQLSTRLTLMPGDLVLTGTPAGTGAESDTFLKAGDVITCRIGGIGTLTTRIG
ncbi:MAG: fumarylacetoacetate hydrolase family protein [Rhodobacteraceae bacterium]|nr:fumarylacetoacetate hydrolase family protein [Paracoccaceae bacterium]